MNNIIHIMNIIVLYMIVGVHEPVSYVLLDAH